jgi:hypothetical protein
MKLKSILFVLVVLNLVVLSVSIIYTGVQMRTQTLKQYKFDLTAGQRILVIENIPNVRVTITPKEAKIFDDKVPAGKIWSGVLAEK